MDKVFWFQSMVGLMSLSQGSPRITFSFPKEMTWKVTFWVIHTFDIEKEGRGEADYPFAIDGVVSISCIDRFLQSHGGEGVCQVWVLQAQVRRRKR